MALKSDEAAEVQLSETQEQAVQSTADGMSPLSLRYLLPILRDLARKVVEEERERIDQIIRRGEWVDGSSGTIEGQIRAAIRGAQ